MRAVGQARLGTGSVHSVRRVLFLTMAIILAIFFIVFLGAIILILLAIVFVLSSIRSSLEACLWPFTATAIPHISSSPLLLLILFLLPPRALPHLLLPDEVHQLIGLLVILIWLPLIVGLIIQLCVVIHDFKMAFDFESLLFEFKFSFNICRIC